MKALSPVVALCVMAFACSTPPSSNEKISENALIGTWQLFSSSKIEKGDTTHTPAPIDSRMIKIINPTHFAFLNHDLKKGQDSVKMFVAGGGSYTLKDNKYTEHLEYCNFREWENNSFEFDVTISNDTLVQQGLEKIEGIGVDRIIIERYVRVTN